MYYDVGHENYKNTKLKEWTLDKFSEQTELSVQAIQRHFTSCRTEHFKLKNRPKSSKSGSGAAPLTSLQKFKLNAYEFLDAHHVSRTLKSTCGRLAGEDEDSASELEYAAASESEPATSQGVGAASKKDKAASVSDMSRTLIACLKSSTKATQDAAEKVRVAQTAAEDPFQAERDAWAEWMTSANNQVPAPRYREFQQETFTTFMKYVPLMPGTQQHPQQQAPKPSSQFVQPPIPMVDPYHHQPMYLQSVSQKPQQQSQPFIPFATSPVRQHQPPDQQYEQFQSPRAVSAPPVTSATYDLSALLALQSPLTASQGSNIAEAAWQLSSPGNIGLNMQSPAQRPKYSSLSQVLGATSRVLASTERDNTIGGDDDNSEQEQE
ncbi:hypothetical protein MAR_018038 [Mya arenaria]|uniref:Uncharacterized protein n=1 Tax=Mya arenaria TaxID=6604 RepID=A0ABY7EG52_MYAAR|nr:uncharacterized protein LOC128237748 [Mya arenaria]WAR08080.1 hypothetical protein MAR_018038 [Mya arenaria]